MYYDPRMSMMNNSPIPTVTMSTPIQQQQQQPYLMPPMMQQQQQNRSSYHQQQRRLSNYNVYK
jgi:hypothetical protein